jgi:aerobic carbon-monoxide dehydrogenase medium subunit
VKSAPFEYRRPESLEEALALLAEYGDEAKPLAGGQSLVPMLAMRLARPALLVDLARVGELRGVEVRDGELRIAAMTTQGALGHFQIRSRGTVGGSLAHMDPAAEWPALAVLLEAELEVASTRGRRTVPAADFMLGPLMSTLEADELLVAVRLSGACGEFGFEEVERRPGDFALVGAACHGGRLVVFATGGTPQRLRRCEAHLDAGGRTAELGRLAEEEIEAIGDVHASAEYRRRVGAALVQRVAAAAL